MPGKSFPSMHSDIQWEGYNFSFEMEMEMSAPAELLVENQNSSDYVVLNILNFSDEGQML